MNKNVIKTAGILSLIMTVLYALVVFSGSHSGLIDSKRMVPLSGRETEIQFEMVPARYLLKVKHQIQDGQAKKVFFNGKELAPYNVKRKKVIETDYFYIRPSDVGEKNSLRVSFNGTHPSDIDVRLYNHIVLPNEQLSYDFFIMFRGSGLRKPVSAPVAGVVFVLGMIFFSVIGGAGRQPFRPMAAASVPFLIVTLLCALNNLLPINPYQLFMSPFFFVAAFVLSFSLMLYPLRHCDDDINT